MSPLPLSRAKRSSSGRIRGAALREFLRWYERKHTSQAMEKATEIMGRTDPGTFQAGLPAFGILSSRWYDAEAIHTLLDVIGGHDGEDVARDGGRVVMTNTLSGVFRAMTRFLVTPERYAANAHRLWSYYYDNGEFTVMNRGPGCAVTTIRDWGAHHPMLCTMNVAAAAVIYQTIGCEDVEVERIGCTERGASSCQYQVKWAAKDV